MLKWSKELQVELGRCTKAELITVVRNNCWALQARDVRYIRGEALLRRAKDLEERGCAMMEKNLGYERRRQYLEGDELWERGQVLRKKADKLMWGKT